MSTYRPAEVTVLDREHNEQCRMAKSKRVDYPWCYVPGYRGLAATVTRDRRGRHHPHGSHTFLVLVCLDTRCPALLLVSERAMATWAASQGGEA